MRTIAESTIPERPGYLTYWGKAREGSSFHRLAYHALDVAAVAAALLDARPRWLHAAARLAGVEPEGLRMALPFLLALHDLGKFGRGFQQLRPDIAEQLGQPPANVPNRPRHDALGFALWKELTFVARDDSASPGVVFLLECRAPAPLSMRDARDLLGPWMSAACGHHGRPPELDAETSLRMQFGVGLPNGSWRDAQAFSVDVRRLLAPGQLHLLAGSFREQRERFHRASWWLSGLAIVSDWVGSNTAWFPYEPGDVELGDYWSRAQAQAQDAVAAAGLEARRARVFGGFAGLFGSDRIPDPSPMQLATSAVPLSSGPQLFLLEDLTGSGKTEAALALVARLLDAGRADGLYFALPTMATANAMHERVFQIVDRLFEATPAPSYVLAHSGPRLPPPRGGLDLHGSPAELRYGTGEQSASGIAAGWLADGRKKALLADVGVGTIDQALIGALRARHNTLRLLGLHGHVLVVDEVHACDEYMNGILEELLRVHASLGGSAILLSATLSIAGRRRLLGAFRRGLDATETELTDSSYPALARCDADHAEVTPVLPRQGSPRQVGIDFLSSREEAVALCRTQAEAGRCVAWIRNTVRDCMIAADELRALLGPDRVTIFHARFPLGDRLAIEQDVVGRFGPASTVASRAGRVVVSTQVLEQSLDVDFDEMVSDIAPVDRLIQRSGRLHRHRRGDRGAPVLRVLAPPWSDLPEGGWPGGEFAGTVRVYTRPSTLWLTQRALRKEGRLDLPVRARALIEAVFGDAQDVPHVLSRSDREVRAEGESVFGRSMALYNRIVFEEGYLRQGAQWADDERAPTRLGEPTSLLRLVRATATGLQPWSSDPALAEAVRWRMGEVTIRASQVAEAAEFAGLREELARRMAEPASFVLPIAMSEAGGMWRGLARDGEGRAVTVIFEQGRGVSIRREGAG